MDRRTFLGTAFGSAAAWSLAGRGAGEGGSASSRPNVIMISVEDMAPLLGCYGHPSAKTPHIDRLGKRGAVFLNAHCQKALCNPSRAAVLTGLRPPNTGVYGNHQDWRARMPDGHRTLPEWFQDHGYQTVSCGKITHGEGQFREIEPEHTAREKAMWTRYLPYRAERPRIKPNRPAAPLPDMLESGDYIDRSTEWGPSGLAPEEQRDGAIAEAVAAFLDQPGTQPFFLAAGFYTPHYSLRAPKPFFDLHDPDDMVLPDSPADDLADVPATFSPFNRADEVWLTEREKREVLAAYHACISYVDHCVGRVLDALDASGRAEDTIVCLWGDHGMHMGEHGLWRKATMFECATRVPFLFAGPRIRRRSAGCLQPAELIDIFPTLAELCRLPEPPGLEAVSMAPILADPGRSWKKAAFTYNRPDHLTLRTERFRYTENGSPERAELYDHRKDPGEHRNVADVPDYAETRTRLAALMRDGWKAALPAGMRQRKGH